MSVLLHQPLVHVLASSERHQRALQEHEPAKRRRTGEENPLPDIGIASMSQPILGVAVESETAGETKRRSNESKELTKGNRETRDWKRSSNSNWEQRRSELSSFAWALIWVLFFLFFFIYCGLLLVVVVVEEEDVCAVWWWWRMFVLCGGGDILFY